MENDPIALTALTVALVILTWKISVADLTGFVIPNAYVAGVLVFGLFACLITAPDMAFDRLTWAVGLFVAGLLISILAEYRAGRPALGMGDVKLFAAATLWVGQNMMGVLLLLAAGTALAVGLVQSGSAGARIAFGPYLAGALVCLWCVGLWQRHQL